MHRMTHFIFETDRTRPIDVICMGRVAVDLYAEQVGVPLSQVHSFKKYLGGCAGNIAVGTARLNLTSCLFSSVGKDDMGQFLLHELKNENVITDYIVEESNHLTGLVLLGICPPDHFPLIFYRENCADMQFEINDTHKRTMAQAKTLLITGTGLSTKKSAQEHHRAITIAREANTKVIIDLDFRPVLWNITDKGDGETRYRSSSDASQHYLAVIPFCDLIVGTEEECLIAAGEETLDRALQKLRKITEAPIIVKRGARGSHLYFDDDNYLNSPGFAVSVLNVLGAGDAFMSGLLRGLLRTTTFETALQFANACGAIVVTRHGCAPAMPNENEMHALIEGSDHVTLSH